MDPGRDSTPLSITPEEQSEIEELRRLLLPTERARLERVERRLDDRAVTADQVGDVIAGAIAAGGARDAEALDAALQDPVSRAMRRSVREDPQSVADALFPVMGPAIRKAIVETVRGMLESTNRAIEASLSVQGIRWRLEAWRSGKSFAEIVLLHSLVYRVEQLLLIHKETGLLLRHVVAPDAAAQDPDMVSGMLTAIRDFVRDSFGGKSGDSLDVFQVGELEVLVEDSPRAALAAVVRGHPPPELRVELERALEAIEARFGTALDSFSGDTAPFAGAKDALDFCLRTRYEEKHPRGRGAVRMVWLAAAVIAALLIGWLVWWRADHRRWTRAIAALDATPGVVVTGSEHRAGAVEIAGLRDPLAEEPIAILERAGVDPTRARLALEPYQSLEDQIVARRRNQELRLELDAMARRVEATPILMRLDSTEILPESLVWLPGLVRDVERALDLARGAGEDASVEVIGHTDLSGDERRNDLLSNRRADRVRELLIERGLPAELVSSRGVAARDFTGDPEAERDLERNRRVDVRVRIGSAPGGSTP
jgi:OOP family OmpA-OmpF porin